MPWSSDSLFVKGAAFVFQTEARVNMVHFHTFIDFEIKLHPAFPPVSTQLQYITGLAGRHPSSGSQYTKVAEKAFDIFGTNKGLKERLL